MQTRVYPACPSCGRMFRPALSWKGANYCRGLYLLRFIEDEPGLSAWTLSQRAGLAYEDTTRGLTKLRAHALVTTEEQERGAGGIRYLYYPAHDLEQRLRFMETLRVAERSNNGY